MIEIKRVKILPSLNNINFKNYTHIFYGVEIDDRTRKIISEIKKNEGVVKTKIRWINSKKEIEINEKK
ncbi:hypothetical protein HGG82_10290 [Marinomonas sp. M1K-6]|uniref:Uncharacterized protein n=1 Tax=Marinomonas profundi TaxID=2726122 RepID=A0A847R2F7_9GAMM|nr:hypothetical protein [Marinomonas profundi]NLQ18015.1 hypothetical protein [Marinomonas profundi]UDV01739.1 hypothetical protein J8N69_08920 [Marinomonas profundi]